MRLFILIGFFITLRSAAQEPVKQPPVTDTSFLEEDYDILFNELDALLDSLTKPRNFSLFNIGVGNSYFNFESKENFQMESQRKLTITPSYSFFSKSGLGFNATAIMVNDGNKLNPYQMYLTGSYDYLKNSKFITGVAFTHFFTKDSLPFYTSPLKNEAYAYFTYKKLWFKPSLAASYGWGSRSDVQDREDYITSFRLLMNGFTRVNTRESINDFNLIASVRHDFYWLDILGNHDYIRLTPQLVFTSGTQKFGFNQSSSSYATLPRTGTNVLYNSDKVYLDDQLYFQPLSLSTYIKAEYAKGRFFIQPQMIFDYYFPANENNFSTAFVLNTGVIF